MCSHHRCIGERGETGDTYRPVKPFLDDKDAPVPINGRVAAAAAECTGGAAQPLRSKKELQTDRIISHDNISQKRSMLNNDAVSVF